MWLVKDPSLVATGAAAEEFSRESIGAEGWLNWATKDTEPGCSAFDGNFGASSAPTVTFVPERSQPMVSTGTKARVFEHFRPLLRVFRALAHFWPIPDTPGVKRLHQRWNSWRAKVDAVRAKPAKERTEEEGAVYVEYITLVFFVGIITASALLSVGVPLLRSYRFAQVIIGAPIP